MQKRIELHGNELVVKYEFTNEHKETLYGVYSNPNKEAEFLARTSNEDIDGNLISCKICQELEEMGFLWEDELAYNIVYKFTSDGESFLENILSGYGLH